MILALDLSSTSTGVCFDGQTETIAPKGSLHQRARIMRDEIRPYLVPAPDLVVIEGIGTRHVQTAIALATVHALVLDEVIDWAPLLVVSPAQLKKFATSRGNANKDQMLIAAMRENPNGDIESNDECDAWWLWCIGEAVCGMWSVRETGYRLDVLASLDEVVEPAAVAS